MRNIRILAGAAAVLMLAGCGSNPSSSGPTDRTDATTSLPDTNCGGSGAGGAVHQTGADCAGDSSDLRQNGQAHPL